MKREQIDDKYKWNLKDFFESDEVFYELAKEACEKIESLKQYENTLGQSKEAFKNAIEEIFATRRLIGNLYTYSHLKNDEDTTDPVYQKMHKEAQNLYVKYSEAVSFFMPEILKIDREKLDEFLTDESLKKYKQYFDNLFRYKEHTLSESEEKMLASYEALSNNPVNTYALLTNADIKFEPVEKNGEKIELNNANFTLLEEDEDRDFRKEVYEHYYQSYKDIANTAASLLEGEINSHVIKARLKKFDSARQMSLFANNIDEAIYDKLVDTVNQNMDLMNEYTDLRKKKLGVDSLHFYDNYMPLVKGYDRKFTFEEAKDIVLKAVSVLGDDYRKIAEKGFDEGWVDVLTSDGKRSGAYSSGSYDSHPYILMNFNGNVDSVFTLAHELGHSMHSYYTRHNQDYIYGSYSIFLAEIASTTNELLLLDYLLKMSKDENEKLYLLNYYVDSFKQTVFRQTMFAEFEHQTNTLIEKSIPLTKDKLNDIYSELLKKYFGKSMEVDDYIAVEWARIPHFYMFYYVYQYATGFSSAVTFSKAILSGDQEKIEKYKDFLKAGESDYPVNVLKKAGIDIANDDTLDIAMQELKTKLHELKERLK